MLVCVEEAGVPTLDLVLQANEEIGPPASVLEDVRAPDVGVSVFDEVDCRPTRLLLEFQRDAQLALSERPAEDHPPPAFDREDLIGSIFPSEREGASRAQLGASSLRGHA